MRQVGSTMQIQSLYILRNRGYRKEKDISTGLPVLFRIFPETIVVILLGDRSPLEIINPHGIRIR